MNETENNQQTPFSELLRNNKPYKIALKFGIYFGIAALIMDLANYAITGDAMGGRSGAMNLLIFATLFIASLFLAVREHKQLDLDGWMPYSRILGLGTLLGLFGGLLFGIYAVIKFQFLAEVDIDLIVHQTLEKMDLNLDSEQYDTQFAMMKKVTTMMMNPLMIFIVSIFNNTLTGFILSLFAGLFMKKNP
jgi:hypothetical protein